MSTLTEFLTGIADAIRGKTGTSDPIPAQNFATEIEAIQTGTDTSDATAGAAQILAPYTAYGASGKLTGTIPSQQAKTVTPGTSAQTAIPAGTYAAGAATVSGDPNLVPENIKEGVSIFGVAGSFAGSSLQQAYVTFGSGINGTIYYMQGGTLQTSTSANPISSAYADIGSMLYVSISSILFYGITVSGSITLLESMNSGSNSYSYLYQINGNGSIQMQGGGSGGGGKPK